MESSILNVARLIYSLMLALSLSQSFLNKDFIIIIIIYLSVYTNLFYRL